MKRILTLVFIALALCFTTSCASFVYTSNYDSYINEQMKNYTYPCSDLPLLWQNAIQLM